MSKTLPRGCGLVTGFGIGICLLLFRADLLSFLDRASSALGGGGFRFTPSDEIRAHSYRLYVLDISGETLYSVLAVVGSLLIFAFFLGLVRGLSQRSRLDGNTAVVVAACLALIALVGSGGRLAHLTVMLYGTGFALIGTLSGGAATGAAVRRGAPAGLLVAAVGTLDAIAFLVAPSSADLQLVFGIVMVLGGIGLYRDLMKEVRSEGGFWAVVWSPPLVGLAVIGAVVVAPLVVAGWPAWQLGLFAVALIGGFASGERR